MESLQIPMILHLKNHPIDSNKGFLSNLSIFPVGCPGARDAWQDQTASHQNPSFEGPLLRKRPQITQVFLEILEMPQ